MTATFSMLVLDHFGRRLDPYCWDPEKQSLILLFFKNKLEIATGSVAIFCMIHHRFYRGTKNNF